MYSREVSNYRVATVREKQKFFKVKEKSGNFAKSQRENLSSCQSQGILLQSS